MFVIFIYSDNDLSATIENFVKQFEIEMTDRVDILIGKDTRPSSPSLSKCVIDGVLALGGRPWDCGIVTTPMLHYFVACKNTNGQYGDPTPDGYYKKLVTAFKKLRGDVYTKENYVPVLLYDGANGVGAKKIKFFQDRLGECMEIKMYNDEMIGSGKLNHMVIPHRII